jgi:hypothetical protein
MANVYEQFKTAVDDTVKATIDFDTDCLADVLVANGLSNEIITKITHQFADELAIQIMLNAHKQFNAAMEQLAKVKPRDTEAELHALIGTTIKDAYKDGYMDGHNAGADTAIKAIRGTGS